MKRIVVLGANGFVGTHVALALHEKPCDLILACRNPEKLHKDIKNEKCLSGDLRDGTYLTKLFTGADVLINVFAWTSMFGMAKESNELFLQPSLKVIDAAKSAGVKRFINLSTISAADKSVANDANSSGMFRTIWPHLNNVVTIEEYLRKNADVSFHVINLRCGIFVGEHYGLGLLPALLPRLKTHLVPLVQGGKTQMPLISGKDVAQAFVKAAFTEKQLNPYEGFNILGPVVPQAKEVFQYIHDEFGYPYPHFSVPFWVAYPFAHLMELLDPVIPFEPLVTRSIIHLLENTNTDNEKASSLLGYEPHVMWQDAIRQQIAEIYTSSSKASLHKEI